MNAMPDENEVIGGRLRIGAGYTAVWGGDRRESAVEQRRGQTSEPYDCLDNLRQLVFGCQLALTELIVRLVSTGLQLRYQDCSY
jgi:hypothetical protein